MATSKPCPGCGDSRFDQFRKAGELCGTCAHKLAWANEMLESQKREKNERCYIYLIPPKGWHRAIDLRAPIYGDHGDSLRKALVEIARSISGIVSPDTEYAPDHSTYGLELFKRDHSFDVRSDFIALTAKQASALRAFAESLATAVKAAYANGERDGERFIRRVAEGKISLESLNERM